MYICAWKSIIRDCRRNLDQNIDFQATLCISGIKPKVGIQKKTITLTQSFAAVHLQKVVSLIREWNWNYSNCTQTPVIVIVKES